MKKMLSVPIVVCTLLVSPLAHSSVWFTDRQDVVTKAISRPEIGTIATAEVGEQLLKLVDQTITTTYSALLKAQVSSDMQDGYRMELAEGMEVGLIARNSLPMSLACFTIKKPSTINFFKKKQTHGCLVDRGNDGTFEESTFLTTFSYFPLAVPIPYELKKTTAVSVDPDKFNFELLYQGLSKGEIKIAYREYVNGLARPAFSQEVAYELKPEGATIIAFKGVRIKVIRADSQSVQYTIEQIPTLP